MKDKKKNKKKTKKILNLVLPPIVILVILTGSMVAFGYSKMSSIVPVLNVFMSDTSKDFSTEYDNIFVPTTNTEDTVNAKDVQFPDIDDQFGELSINSANVSAKLFYGDSDQSLKKGVGVYAGSFIPGYNKTILIAGHNATYFNGLKNVVKGNIITIKTSYGNYKYKVTSTRITTDTDKSAYDLSKNKENLILYTCYPFDQLGLTNKRFFVYAKKLSGPKIVGLYD